jgi:Zn-dependent protease with chaperone function
VFLTLVGLIPFTIILALVLGVATGGVGFLLLMEPFIDIALGQASSGIVLRCTVSLGISTSAMLLFVYLRRRSFRRAGERFARNGQAIKVSRRPDDPWRQLRNVVDEMALVYGIPAPSLYLLPQSELINALSIGHSPADAALMVTRGAVERLKRAELQALVAHEFSHILNGDMAFGIRVCAWISAFNLCPSAGLFILRMPWHDRFKSRPWDKKIGATIGWALYGIPIGTGLTLIGLPHFFAARFLQSGLGRERERLADASALGATRDAAAIKGALLKTAVYGSTFPDAPQDFVDSAHMFFAAVDVRRWLSSHPPIEERLRAVDAGFRDDEIAEFREREGVRELRERRLETAAIASREQQAHARHPFAALIFGTASLPTKPADPLRWRTFRTPTLPPLDEIDSAPRSALLALLFDGPDRVLELQLAMIEETLGADTRASAQRLSGLVATLSVEQRMPLLDRVLPSLREIDAKEARVLQELLSRLALVDLEVEVFEFALMRMVGAFLGDLHAPRALHGNRTLAASANELRVLFSVLAGRGSTEARSARGAYEAGLSRLLPTTRPEYVSLGSWVNKLDHALRVLDTLQPMAKQALVEAMFTTVRHDQCLTVEESELVRAISASLHFPVPPFSELLAL